MTVAERNGRAEVVVADTGIGIPAEKLGAIFEPFVQVDSGLTRTVGGSSRVMILTNQTERKKWIYQITKATSSM